MPPIRRIAHLDMDAFYASVELLRYPQLKGLPVVIGGGRRREDDLLGRLRTARPDQEWSVEALHRIPVDFFPLLKDYTGRGVITTATYAARQFGVGSAMGLMKAAKLCPDAILLPVDFDQYRHYSQRFKSIITDIAPLMENRGVDEVYIDFTDVPGGQRESGIRPGYAAHRQQTESQCRTRRAASGLRRARRRRSGCTRARRLP